MPGFFQRKSEIISLEPNLPDTTFNVLYEEKGFGGSNLLKIRTYSHHGAELFEHKLVLQEGYKVLNGKTGNLSGEAMVLAGTFGETNSHYAQGILFAKIGKDGQESTKYVHFSELENFLNYMHPKRSERIKDKINRRNAKGKRYEFRSKVILHELLESPEGYMLLAETYQTRYEPNQPNIYYDPYSFASANTANYGARKYIARPQGYSIGQPTPSSYDFDQAVVVRFSQNGRLAWDQNFAIEEVEKPSLRQVVAMRKTGDGVELLYKSKNRLHSKMVAHGKIVRSDTSQLIQLKNPEDEFQDNPYEDLGNAMRWYDKYFLVWGYRRLERQSTSNKENVFYLNKVSFD